MPDTFIKIATVTVGSGGAANISFSSIPSTYTDLKLLLSTRSTTTASNLNLQFNGSSTAVYDTKRLYGNGSSALSDGFTNQAAGYVGWQNQSTYTASTFSNIEIYIPNYAGSRQKSVSNDGVSETNATTAAMGMHAILWKNTAAITSIEMTDGGGNFVQYSTATLYGISKS